MKHIFNLNHEEFPEEEETKVYSKNGFLHVPKGSDGYYFTSKKALLNTLGGELTLPDGLKKPFNLYPKKIGRSHWYELTNGKKVLGKSKALEAQKQLRNE